MELGGPYTELGGAFGPIQAISDFINLITAVISEQTVRDFICVVPLGFAPCCPVNQSSRLSVCHFASLSYNCCVLRK